MFLLYACATLVHTEPNKNIKVGCQLSHTVVHSVIVSPSAQQQQKMRFVIFGRLIEFSVLFYCEANFVLKTPSYAVLPRFWTGSGFSPSAPLPFNRTSIVQQLSSEHVKRNLDFVAALPNAGIKHMRIHWLLSLIDFK